MSDTPETDAKASPVFGKHSCATVLADFARKLERERDEALALAEERKGYWDDSVKEYEELRASFQRITRERDKYKNAILECLEKNCHLADGEDCTLIGLKKALL